MGKFTNREVEVIYQAYMHCQTEKTSDYNEFLKYDAFTGAYFDEAGNRFSPSMRFYNFLIGFNSFDKFPVVVSDYKFNRIKRKPMFHGFQKFDHGASILTDYNYHIGMGNRTIGTFFSELQDDALKYTVSTKYNDERISDDRRIMKTKIISDNFIELPKLECYCYNILNNNIENIEEGKDKEKIIELYNFCFMEKNQENPFVDETFTKANFWREIVNNPVVLALYLKYDYVKKTYRGTNIEHNILFNRGVMVTSRSQANKFLENSDNYQNAIVNFLENFDVTLEK